MKVTSFQFAIAIWAATVGSGWSQGTVLFQHLGSVDPTNEGFNLLRNGNPSLTPVADSGANAWGIYMRSGDIGIYSLNLAPQQNVLASGWELSLRLQVLSPFNQPTFGISATFYTGTQYFSLLFGAGANGDPIVNLVGRQYSLSGDGYHNYQLRFDASENAASFWVDGVQLAAGIRGSPNQNSPNFVWGGGQNPLGSVNANWNEVSLWAIPEPSALALLGFGGLLVAAHLLRRRPRFMPRKHEPTASGSTQFKWATRQMPRRSCSTITKQPAAGMNNCLTVGRGSSNPL